MTVDFGTDIDSSWSATPQGDFKLVSGVDNAVQAIKNRLLTRLGEMDWCYENYGTESNQQIGETDLATAEATIELCDTIALLQEPRVEDIYGVSVKIEQPNTIIEDLTIKLIDEDKTTNLIIKKEV